MKPLFYSLVLLSCAACNSQLVPLDFQPELDNTQSFIEVGDVSYTMEFVKATDQLVTFWMHIDNQSEDTVFLNDRRLMSYTSPTHFEPDSEIIAEGVLSEKDIEYFYQEKVRNARTLAVASVIFGAVLVVADASADIRDHNKETWTRKDERKYQTRNAVTDLGLFASDVAFASAQDSKLSAKEELRYLPSEMFLLQAIPPGESHSGKLLFRNEVIMKYYQIHVEANGLSLRFDFRRANGQEKAALRNQ
ncbi:hypothetical protein [Marinoscillum sp.]|uniref:hypothetical protein n=1 Tax=Marinoscillum sp. TaxID=2024838 RepID=UPI003BA9B13B